MVILCGVSYMEKEKRNCGHCGEEVNINLKICPYCGYTVKDDKYDYDNRGTKEKNILSNSISNNSNKKLTTKDKVGIALIILGFISIPNQHTFSGIATSILFILLGISLLSFLYNRVLSNIKIKNLNIILPIFLVILYGISNGIYNNLSSNNYRYDSNQRIEEIKKKLTNYKWPSSDMASLISKPNSNIGIIEWETSKGFVAYIGEISKEEFDDYVENCSLKGFSVDYRKGSDYYYASNKDGYKLSLNYHYY